MGRICIPAECATCLEKVVEFCRREEEFCRMHRFDVETEAVSCVQRVMVLGSLKIVGE